MAFKYIDDPHLALLALRTWPGPNSNTPTAMLLYSRPIRTILLSMNSNIAIKNKKIYKKTIVINIITLLNLIQRKVRLHDGQTWKIKGEFVEYLNEPPRSHLIRTENGNILRRNRKHILLWKGRNSNSYFKNETDDNEDLFNFIDKRNNTTNQIIYIMKLKKQQI